jgi:hypothetical protein
MTGQSDPAQVGDAEWRRPSRPRAGRAFSESDGGRLVPIVIGVRVAYSLGSAWCRGPECGH